MDLATIVGLVAAFGLMVSAILQGGSLLIFIDVPSVIIVIGGTIGTSLVNFPFSDILSAFKVARHAFFHKAVSPADTIGKLINYAGKARKEGILSLQSVMGEIEDEFFLKGLQMAVDGQEPDALKEMLDKEIEYVMERHEKGADIFMTFAAISPAMGMIGTLIGLVQMLQNMNDPSSIGPAMAVAWSMVSSAIKRYVVHFPPVIVTRPEAEINIWCSRPAPVTVRGDRCQGSSPIQVVVDLCTDTPDVLWLIRISSLVYRS